ncbi:MAG TPA: hypothetical protein HA282_00775 [Nanoarchaeota archaeon]|nr:MAG: hypothetical protein QT01_C0002G0026 [archaeon GW2011_AR6]HIH17245.1 hypothetical protein [Nanoarchaeota archaeon]HIH34291.1 hypothetical protein [Nanoarchaeota archaeon]HIH50851.1 hypothetical protein [Nanoarchaeota archaeon]HIH65736.1 hypothetical protein [Nanoarchaeota archaeon]
MNQTNQQNQMNAEKQKQEQVKVLLIHGYNGNPKVFADIKRRLKGRALVETVRYDSSKPFPDWIKSIDRRINKHNPEDLYVIGHSLGGSLALYLSQKYKFKGLVTINSPVYLRKHTFIKVLTRVLRRFKHANKVALKNAKYSLDSVSSLFDFLGSIGKMKVDSLHSALVIQSRKDGVVNPRSARIIYERIQIPRKQLVNVGRGHSPLDQPQVISTILGFLGLV